jgi:aldose 1-epimerase
LPHEDGGAPRIDAATTIQQAAPAPMKLPIFLILLTLAAPLHAQRAVVAQTPDGQPVEAFTLTNQHGMRARIITWGATLIELQVPDRTGKLTDVTLGFDHPASYLESHPGFGTVIGRYANRIAHGKFTLDGKEIVLAKSGKHHIHGGPGGFGKRNWRGDPAGAGAVRFTYTSAAGEEGFPGKMTVTVTYTLTEEDELRLEYEATTDQPTVVNLTNHAYFNLAGRGDVLGHELRLHASRYTVPDRDLIPTGEIAPVKSTPLDFTTAKTIGRDLAALQAGGLVNGYDHNYVIDHASPGALTLAAELHDPISGRVMRVSTTEPGLQLYTGNYLKGLAGRGGAIYGPQAGVCFETQHFPDSPNHPHFPTTTLRPGETFRSTTIFAFSAK